MNRGGRRGKLLSTQKADVPQVPKAKGLDVIVEHRRRVSRSGQCLHINPAAVKPHSAVADDELVEKVCEILLGPQNPFDKFHRGEAPQSA